MNSLGSHFCVENGRLTVIIKHKVTIIASIITNPYILSEINLESCELNLFGKNHKRFTIDAKAPVAQRGYEAEEMIIYYRLQEHINEYESLQNDQFHHFIYETFERLPFYLFPFIPMFFLMAAHNLQKEPMFILPRMPNTRLEYELHDDADSPFYRLTVNTDNKFKAYLEHTKCSNSIFINNVPGLSTELFVDIFKKALLSTGYLNGYFESKVELPFQSLLSQLQNFEVINFFKAVMSTQNFNSNFLEIIEPDNEQKVFLRVGYNNCMLLEAEFVNDDNAFIQLSFYCDNSKNFGTLSESQIKNAENGSLRDNKINLQEYLFLYFCSVFCQIPMDVAEKVFFTKRYLPYARHASLYPQHIMKLMQSWIMLSQGQSYANYNVMSAHLRSREIGLLRREGKRLRNYRH